MIIRCLWNFLCILSQLSTRDGVLKFNVDNAARGKPGPPEIGWCFGMLERVVLVVLSSQWGSKTPMKQR